MQITWHGLNAVKIQGKDSVILIDPHAKMSRQKADLIIASSDTIDTQSWGQESFVIDTPGEYESKGAFVYGIPWKLSKSDGRTVLYRIQFEELAIAHLGGIDHVITDEELETLEGIDILFIPVGDMAVLETKEALDIVSRIEPRVIIPININGDGLQGPEKLLKELGGAVETINKLKISRKELPEAERRVIVLEQS